MNTHVVWDSQQLPKSVTGFRSTRALVLHTGVRLFVLREVSLIKIPGLPRFLVLTVLHRIIDVT